MLIQINKKLHYEWLSIEMNGIRGLKDYSVFSFKSGRKDEKKLRHFF